MTPGSTTGEEEAKDEERGVSLGEDAVQSGGSGETNYASMDVEEAEEEGAGASTAEASGNRDVPSPTADNAATQGTSPGQSGRTRVTPPDRKRSRAPQPDDAMLEDLEQQYQQVKSGNGAVYESYVAMAYGAVRDLGDAARMKDVMQQVEANWSLLHQRRTSRCGWLWSCAYGVPDASRYSGVTANCKAHFRRYEVGHENSSV